MKTSLSLPCFALASLLALSVAPVTRAFTWEPSQLVGAGTQNCIAIQPGGTGVILSASDVSGIQRSTNYGASWLGANLGVPAGGPGKVAVVCWSNSSTHANTAYAGDNDGFLSSTDAGQTWSLLSGTPNFNGQGTWPRAVGNLIACDQSSSFPGYLYCGSGNSILRSTDGGSTWSTIFTDGAGKAISGLALNPSTPTTLYIATQGDGTYSTVNARTVGTGGWTHLATTPSRPEELLVLTDGSLYAAGTDATAGGGVWKWNGSSFASLGAPKASGKSYLGISGYGTGSTATIYACATSPASDGTADASVIKTTDSGSTWSNITQTANVVNQIGGAGGPAWWQMLAGAAPYYELGASSGDMESIAVDPSNHGIVFTSGRGGVWATTNATAAAGSILWYPYVSGLSVCVANWAATDPNHAGRIYVTDEDWTFFYSTDGGNTFRRNGNGMSTGTTGRPIFVDPLNSTVYCGQLQDDSSLVGDIYSNADPTTGGAWASTGFKNGASSGAKPRGVAAGRDSSGHVALVAVSDKSNSNAPGLWYSDNGGTWVQKSTSITPSGAQVVPIAWNANSAYVFVYSQNSGLWRSSDRGVSWTSIWANGSSGVGTGFLVEDPDQEGRLYLSTSSGVYRFADARTGSSFTPTNLGGPANPGAMTLANGILYCCDRYTTVGTNSSMYRWLAPATSATSAVISNGPYSGQSQWPSGLAVDSNGTIYLSEKDEGCMLGLPLLYADTFSSGTSNWTPDGGTWSVVSVGGGNAYQGSNATSSALAYLNVSGSTSWQSYSMSADVTPVSFTAGSCGVSLYFTDANDRYMVQITPAGAVNIKSDVGGTQTTLASGTYTYTSGQTYTIRLVANNVAGTLTAYLGSTQVAQATGISFSPASGTGALNVFDGTADFTNVLIDQL